MILFTLILVEVQDQVKCVSDNSRQTAVTFRGFEKGPRGPRGDGHLGAGSHRGAVSVSSSARSKAQVRAQSRRGTDSGRHVACPVDGGGARREGCEPGLARVRWLRGKRENSNRAGDLPAAAGKTGLEGRPVRRQETRSEETRARGGRAEVARLSHRDGGGAAADAGRTDGQGKVGGDGMEEETRGAQGTLGGAVARQRRPARGTPRSRQGSRRMRAPGCGGDGTAAVGSETGPSHGHRRGRTRAGASAGRGPLP